MRDTRKAGSQPLANNLSQANLKSVKSALPGAMATGLSPGSQTNRKNIGGPNHIQMRQGSMPGTASLPPPVFRPTHATVQPPIRPFHSGNGPAQPSAGSPVNRFYRVGPALPVANGGEKIQAFAAGRSAAAGSLTLTGLRNGAMNVHNLHVESDFRRQGVARMLLQAAVSRAQARGCRALTLEVHPGAQAQVSSGSLVQMYQKLGFRSVGLSQRGNTLMERNLGPLSVKPNSPNMPAALSRPFPPVFRPQIVGIQRMEDSNAELERLRRTNERGISGKRAATGRPLEELQSSAMEWRDTYDEMETTTYKTGFGPVKASKGRGGQPNITSREEDFGGAKLDTTYVSIISSLAKCENSAKYILASLEGDGATPELEEKYKRAAAMFVGITHVAEEARGPGSAKTARALLRAIQDDAVTWQKAFSTANPLYVQKVGAQGLNDILKGVKALSKALKGIIHDYMSDSSDEETAKTKGSVFVVEKSGKIIRKSARLNQK